jgi:hypothetical protein
MKQLLECHHSTNPSQLSQNAVKTRVFEKETWPLDVEEFQCHAITTLPDNQPPSAWRTNGRSGRVA